MNKNQIKLIKEAEIIKAEELHKMKFEMIYIVPQNKKHDSGYKMIYVVGNSKDKDYLIATYSDVIDFNYM